MKRFNSQLKKYWILAIAGFIFTVVSLIPVRLAIAYHQAPQPQAFFILGGGIEREKLTAELAQWYPSLEIWVSSGSSSKDIRKTFQAAGVSLTRVHIDNNAVDTVTNFTSLVNDFKQHHIQHLFLVTSSFHMPRAKAIATIIFGSQGIAFTPVSVPTINSPESELHILRDCVRALIWVFTGYTGAELKNTRIDSPL
ncbi:hypothetical protein AMR41_14110 [Hapalosiphon sp. MRB220]|nr:hypothetical protein AMR41_14110 [Hapalosiphon sp. MRB220]